MILLTFILTNYSKYREYFMVHMNKIKMYIKLLALTIFEHTERNMNFMHFVVVDNIFAFLLVIQS